MKKQLMRIAAKAVPWLLLGLAGYAGYLIAKCGGSLFGDRSMMIGASIVATIAVLSLFGQYLSGTSDYFLSIENPRPLDEEEDIVTIMGWGFASRELAQLRRRPRRAGFRRHPAVREPQATAQIAGHLRFRAAGHHRLARQCRPASAGAGVMPVDRDHRGSAPPTMDQLSQDRLVEAEEAVLVAQRRVWTPAAPTSPKAARAVQRWLTAGAGRGCAGAARRRRLVAVEHPDRPGRLDAQHPPLQPLLQGCKAADLAKRLRKPIRLALHAGRGGDPDRRDQRQARGAGEIGAAA